MKTFETKQNSAFGKIPEKVHQPQILGILNVTADSFSDGGRYLEKDAACRQAQALYSQGADFVELGPASSNPNASPVSVEEEARRIIPVIEFLSQENIPFALDSCQPDTQLLAAAHGATLLNDILGFPNEAICEQLSSYSCNLVMMHSMQQKTQADTTRYGFSEVWDHLLRFFEAGIERLVRAGIAQERIILDPGMGFFLSSDPLVSIAVLQKLPELKERFCCELFVSVSRKSFLRALAETSVEESGVVSVLAELACVQRGVRYIRTHEPKPLRAALRFQQALSTIRQT